MEQFIDLLHTPSLVWPLLLGFLALWMVVAIFVYRLQIDTIAEQMEAERLDKERQRLSDFYQTGELPPSPEQTPKERMAVLTGAEEPSSDGWIEELLKKYQLWLFVSKGSPSASVVDARFPGLKHSDYPIDYLDFRTADRAEQERIVRRARYVLNRRAKRAGLTPLKKAA